MKVQENIKIGLIIFLLILIIGVTLFFLQKSQRSKPTAFERETKMIESYHKMVLKEKGSKYFFIEKSKIDNLLFDYSEVSLNELEKDDLIIFIDTLGNVQYQATVYQVQGKIIKISCLNLETGNDYITDLDFNKIVDIDTSLVKDIKSYRKLKKSQ